MKDKKFENWKKNMIALINQATTMKEVKALYQMIDAKNRELDRKLLSPHQPTKEEKIENDNTKNDPSQ